jgi:hypothetical protein
MHRPAAFIAACSSSVWGRIMAWRLVMTVGRAIQAVVENIPRNHTLLAQVSIASVVCVVLAVKA